MKSPAFNLGLANPMRNTSRRFPAGESQYEASNPVGSSAGWKAIDNLLIKNFVANTFWILYSIENRSPNLNLWGNISDMIAFASKIEERQYFVKEE
jgi:hypothetical protein